MMYEKCEVEASFNRQGVPKPTVIHWNDETLQILDYGRRWTMDDGLHLLIRVADGRVLELWYNAAHWHIRPLSSRSTEKFV